MGCHSLSHSWKQLKNMAATRGSAGWWQYAKVSPHGITERKRRTASYTWSVVLSYKLICMWAISFPLRYYLRNIVCEPGGWSRPVRECPRKVWRLGALRCNLRHFQFKKREIKCLENKTFSCIHLCAHKITCLWCYRSNCTHPKIDINNCENASKSDTIIQAQQKLKK